MSTMIDCKDHIINIVAAMKAIREVKLKDQNTLFELYQQYQRGELSLLEYADAVREEGWSLESCHEAIYSEYLALVDTLAIKAEPDCVKDPILTLLRRQFTLNLSVG